LTLFELPEPKDDGLVIPEVGEWSHEKHYFLRRYIDAFTTAMKDKPWAGLHYIDLFAGAGIEKLERSATLEWGSPLIAAQSPNKFDGLHLCEKDKEKYDALLKRINKCGAKAHIHHGDSNKKIGTILAEIPDKTLSLAFLDPYGLHLHFPTLTALAQKRVDMIIFFPDYLDVLRNWEKYYLSNPKSNLDLWLGLDIDWREIMKKTPRDRQVETLRNLYLNQIQRKLGYEYFDHERISRQGRPLYSLIFCSRHETGGGIWRRIAGKKPDGQRTFGF
jgi:three-Cys-motif partner protein